MYLRTPKRYTRGQRRSIISLRWLWLWILTPLVIFAGLQLYQNRSDLSPQVQSIISGVIESAQDTVSTATAPTPMPTENPDIRLSAASAAWQRGSIEEAVNIYDDVVQAVPNRVDVYYLWTLGLAMEGQLDAALAAAERTITADPYSADAWAIRAMVLNWNRRPAEAIPSALRALELVDNSEENAKSRARAHAFLAEGYLRVGQYERALSTVDRALEIDPNSFEALHVRSRIAQEYLFDFTTAMRHSQAAYNIAPNLPYLGLELAVLNVREQQIDTALGILRDILELNPRNRDSLRWMGTVYLNTVGDPNQAADYLSRCVEVSPDGITCLYLLGRAQWRQEQYASALDSFQRAVELGTTDPYHYWWAARAQVTQNGCPAAVSYLQTGWELAQQRQNDQVIIDSYIDQMRSCQLFVDPSFEEADPEATEEAFFDDEGE